MMKGFSSIQKSLFNWMLMVESNQAQFKTIHKNNFELS